MTTDLIERTPEQLLAIEKRKADLKIKREEEAREKSSRGKRRVMDADATLKMLVKQKIVTTTWANRISKRKDSRRWIAAACIANMVDAISKVGTSLNLNPVTGYRPVK